VDSLTFAAFYFNPALGEARAHLDAIRAGEKTARQRQNPTLSATVAYDNQIPDNPTPWSLVPLSLDLPFETAGKRGDRIRQAEALSRAAACRLQSLLWQTRTEVRSALLERQHLAGRLALLRAQAAAQGRIVQLLEGQQAAGNVSGAEVTQARIAAATDQVDAEDGEIKASEARARLATALGLPVRALEQADLRPIAAQPPTVPDPADFRRRGLIHRADVRQALFEYAAAQAALQLEIANQYPDIHLGPGYQYNSGSAGDNQWQLSLSLSLPILNQNQGPIAEAKAKRSEAAAHFLAVQAQALGEIDAAAEAVTAARNQARAAESLAAGLRRRRESAQALRQVGETDPLARAGAEVEYLTGELARLDAQAAALDAYGRLEAAVQDPALLPPSAAAPPSHPSSDLP